MSISNIRSHSSMNAPSTRSTYSPEDLSVNSAIGESNVAESNVDESNVDESYDGWVAELNPQAAESLRVSIVSDAIAGRNGVGTYYLDLIRQLEGKLGSINLVGPSNPADRKLERFSISMPGDRSQRLVMPYTRELWRRLDEQQPNLIVIPTIGPFSFLAQRYAASRKLPYLFVTHTDFDRLLPLYYAKWKIGPLKWMLNQINRWMTKRATSVAAMNPQGLHTARELGADVVRVMGTPISADFIQTPVARPAGGVQRLIFVGRLATEKRVTRLLAAMQRLPQVSLTIVGDGPLKEEVLEASRALENVTFKGWLPRQEVLREIDSADMLVLPSSIETFGTVALEALARSRYVLVGEECGIRKWASIAKGLFYFKEDEELADVITRIRAMPDQQRIETGQQSWDEVQRFNDYTLRLWIRFMVDATDIGDDEKQTVQNEADGESSPN